MRLLTAIFGVLLAGNAYAADPIPGIYSSVEGTIFRIDGDVLDFTLTSELSVDEEGVATVTDTYIADEDPVSLSYSFATQAGGYPFVVNIGDLPLGSGYCVDVAGKDERQCFITITLGAQKFTTVASFIEGGEVFRTGQLEDSEAGVNSIWTSKLVLELAP